LRDNSDNQETAASGIVTRDQVISAIYETVISPGQFESFLDVWAEHLQGSLEYPAETPLGGSPLEHLEGAQDLGKAGRDAELQQHFARAYQILDQLGRKAPDIDIPARVRAADGLVLALSARGAVVATSNAASEWLGTDSDIAGLKERITPHSWQLLESLISSAAEGTALSDPPVVLAADGTPRHLVARAVRSGDAPGPMDGIAVHVLIEAMDFHWNARAEEMLVVSFGLSGAEVGLVRHLMGGLTLRAIAEKTGRSEHTVRNQAKSVLAKTGAPGQVELIRLVAFLVNEETRSRTGAEFAGKLKQDIRNGPDRRKLQIFRAGKRGGTPLIFLHGMLDATASLQFFTERLRSEGYDVHAPMRPGYGLSDPVIRPETAMDVVTDQIRDLITREKLEKPLILGHLAGGIYGHILAHRLRDRIAGLVAVCSGAPVTRLGDISSMNKRVRVMAYTTRFTPSLLPAVLRAGIAMIDSNDVDAFMDAQFPEGTADRCAIRQLNLAPLIQDGYRLSVKQGAAGFACDAYWALRDWGVLADGPMAPAIYLHGRHDTVNKAERITRAMPRWPEVQVRVCEDVGQMLFYERPDLVFGALKELALHRA
jgi:pimeloyl-ACP methyl ester carboxylesterase/DNA-binding CsgD family transcriptional regulator